MGRKQEWQCRAPGESTVTVNAYEPVDAAEIFAEKYDMEWAERFPYGRGVIDTVEILIDGQWKSYKIEVWQEIQYLAVAPRQPLPADGGGTSI